MNILDEYVKITRVIENIQNKINQYIESMDEIIENTQDESERDKKIKEFKTTIERIKNDHEITQKYRQLKNRQKELRELLIPPNSNINDKMKSSNTNFTSTTDNLLSDLKIRYDKLSKQQIVLVDDENSDQTQLELRQSVENI